MTSYEQERLNEEREAKRLAKMSVPELEKELEKQLKAALIKRIEKLEDDVTDIISNCASQIIFASLGVVDDGYGKWEMTHTNGKQTVLADALAAHALKQVQMAIPNFIEELTKPVVMPKWRKALLREYRDHLGYQLSQKLKVTAEDAATHNSTTIVAKLTKDAGLKLKKKKDEAAS